MSVVTSRVIVELAASTASDVWRGSLASLFACIDYTPTLYSNNREVP